MVDKMKTANIASCIDFANHHPNSTSADIEKLCKDVTKYGFNSAFVNQSYVRLAKKILKGKALVGTVISFPLGQDTLESKIYAVNSAVKAGADELDIVPNLGTFKEKKYDKFLSEMKSLVKAAKRNRKVVVKFIVEAGYLSDKEIAKFARLIMLSGADFVKICSGMGPRGPSVKDVKIVRRVVKNKIKIKVAGGISTYKKACQMLEAGADRIGTSHAIEIMQGMKGGSEKRRIVIDE